MDLFEILFILLFVLFPIMEQVMKRRRQSGDEADPGSPGQVRDGEEAPDHPQRPDRAADMVPEDLWAILTGERPPGGVATGEPGEEAAEPAPWSSEPEPVEASTADEAWRTGSEAREAEALEAEAPAPGSREYRGPEAYSLETLDHPATSLERPIPTPEARHRAFHARYDRPKRRRPRTRSAISRALGDARSVRQAFILKEVLGTPKGLE